MIQIMRAEKLSEQLSKLRGVIEHYEAGQVDFVSLALCWLSEAETLLREERIPEATDILTARANVISAKDRAIEQGKSSGGKRRAEALAAIDAVRIAEALLRGRLLSIEENVDRYEDKLVEAVTALVLLGAMPSCEGVGRNAWTLDVWTALATQSSTRPTATWLSAALSGPDRLYLLDRILMRLRSYDLPCLNRATTMADADTEGS